MNCRYPLEPPRRGGSNEYKQSMFLIRNKKNNVYPCKPQFYYIKWGLRESKLYRHVFVMIYSFIFQITYSGASPLLSDREIYPRLFKLEASDSRFNLARIELARRFNWKKVATLNVALDYFSAVR